MPGIDSFLGFHEGLAAGKLTNCEDYFTFLVSSSREVFLMKKSNSKNFACLKKLLSFKFSNKLHFNIRQIIQLGTIKN